MNNFFYHFYYKNIYLLRKKYSFLFFFKSSRNSYAFQILLLKSFDSGNAVTGHYQNHKVTSYSFPSQSWVCPLKTSHGTFLCLAQESNLRHLACFRALWSECNMSAALNRKLFSHTNSIRSLTSILIGWKFTFTVNNVLFLGFYNDESQVV